MSSLFNGTLDIPFRLNGSPTSLADAHQLGINIYVLKNFKHFVRCYLSAPPPFLLFMLAASFTTTRATGTLKI